MTEQLRALALERLGPMGHELAREALEHGTLEIHRNVLAWQGSLGEVRGHRVIVLVDEELRARVAELPGAVDALTSAVAAAIAIESGNALAELIVRARPPDTMHGGKSASPYRGRT